MSKKKAKEPQERGVSRRLEPSAPSVRVCVCLTEDERDESKKRAHKEKVTHSAYIRQAVVARLKG